MSSDSFTFLVAANLYNFLNSFIFHSFMHIFCYFFVCALFILGMHLFSRWTAIFGNKMYHWLVLQLIAKFGVIQSQFNSELFEISMTILATLFT